MFEILDERESNHLIALADIFDLGWLICWHGSAAEQRAACGIAIAKLMLAGV
jgi:hypothetical protein